MKSDLHVASPPAKPLVIFDGDCQFCALWIRRWQQATGDGVEYAPFQDSSVSSRFPELAREHFEIALHLIEPNGAVYDGAEAVFRALAHNPSRELPLRWYQSSAQFAALTERCYRFVAEHRPMFSSLTRWGWGRHVERPTQFLVRPVFLRTLALIYLIAFVSLWTQVIGLVGSNGIEPAGRFISAAKQHFDERGVGADRFRLLPTLCWWSASDMSLHLQCATGVLLAGLLFAGIAPAPCLFLLWLIYLSLSTVCREFLGFQWDILLLETGLLAIFFAPLQLWPHRRAGHAAPPSRLVLWLLRALLFKLMFESGCVKLLSGDVTWHNLTALTVHYETQPLPTWIGWYAHQLPQWFQKFACFVMFAVELVCPFSIFGPRRLRFLGGAAMASLQFIILLTGNYTFFNWLTLALCLLLLDDFALEKMTPAWLREWFAPHEPRAPIRAWPRPVTIPLAFVIVSISLLQLAAMFRVRSVLLLPAAVAYEWLAPLRSVNNYGLFAVMTTSRAEIIVEGSNDGTNWLPYEFKYKPGDVNRPPGFVAPHQPRLDWQMWFAALGTYRENPWFVNFCVRLLQGSPEVLALLETNPFPDKPPRHIRAVAYDYRFTSFAERRQTGAWWKRERRGEYLPTLSSRE